MFAMIFVSFCVAFFLVCVPAYIQEYIEDYQGEVECPPVFEIDSDYWDVVETAHRITEASFAEDEAYYESIQDEIWSYQDDMKAAWAAEQEQERRAAFGRTDHWDSVSEFSGCEYNDYRGWEVEAPIFILDNKVWGVIEATAAIAKDLVSWQIPAPVGTEDCFLFETTENGCIAA